MLLLIFTATTTATYTTTTMYTIRHEIIFRHIKPNNVTESTL